MKRWWIHQDKILGVSNPTISELRELHEGGFRTVVCLLDESQQKPKYDRVAVLKMGLVWDSIPMKDFSKPTLDQFQRFKELLEMALRRGKVVVHCEGGSGRTGTMAGAYWIYQGFTADEAIQRVREANAHAIETDGQQASLRELERAGASFAAAASLELVCFDLRGVIVDHNDDKSVVPGMRELIGDLADRGNKLAIVSSFPPDYVARHLEELQCHFADRILFGSGASKLDAIRAVAATLNIHESKVAFVEDKPNNLVPVSQNSSVRVIGFLGSGKYRDSLQKCCDERGLHFACSVEQLRSLLGLGLHREQEPA